MELPVKFMPLFVSIQSAICSRLVGAPKSSVGEAAFVKLLDEAIFAFMPEAVQECAVQVNDIVVLMKGVMPEFFRVCFKDSEALTNFLGLRCRIVVGLLEAMAAERMPAMEPHFWHFLQKETRMDATADCLGRLVGQGAWCAICAMDAPLSQRQWPTVWVCLFSGLKLSKTCSLASVVRAVQTESLKTYAGEAEQNC
jgi:hypothetical protein